MCVCLSGEFLEAWGKTESIKYPWQRINRIIVVSKRPWFTEAGLSLHNPPGFTEFLFNEHWFTLTLLLTIAMRVLFLFTLECKALLDSSAPAYTTTASRSNGMQALKSSLSMFIINMLCLLFKNCGLVSMVVLSICTSLSLSLSLCVCMCVYVFLSLSISFFLSSLYARTRMPFYSTPLFTSLCLSWSYMFSSTLPSLDPSDHFHFDRMSISPTIYL